MVRQLDRKSQKHKHNYIRDLILIIVALVVVVFYFQSEGRFFLDASTVKHSASESGEKLVYAGPTTPEDLELTSKDLAAVDLFIKKNGKHFRQIQIFIERQDSYGKVKDTTQLRFYTLTRYNDGTEIKSVYTPCTRKQFPARVVRRLRDDITNYFSVKKNNKGTEIKGFTNTM